MESIFGVLKVIPEYFLPLQSSNVFKNMIFFLLGVKFLVLTDPKQGPMDSFLKRFHELYTDYALKNPFYSLEMPIR